MNITEEAYAWNGALSKRTKPTEYIILHHAAASICTVQDVHKWHQNASPDPYIGIGYHYFVRKDGSVYRGRPYDTIGAYTIGYNDRSVGVCAEGNFMSETMPDAQKGAIIELCRELLAIWPDAKVVGHGNCNATACPGANYPLAEIQKGALDIEPKSSDWAKDSWEKAIRLGVFDGTDPQGAVTREMLAVVLDRRGLLG